MKVCKLFSRNFLIAASAYRRQARERRLDFSLQSLRDQYRHETHGGLSPDASVNGYTCGKWVLDATIKQMRQDHEDGLITKHELRAGSSAFIRREIGRWMPVKWYPNP